MDFFILYMNKPGGLEELSEHLSEYYRHSPDWGEFISAFKSHEDFNLDNEFTLHQYVDNFKQISLELALKEIDEQHPELNVSLDSRLKDGERSNKFRIKYDKSGRIFVHFRYRHKGRKFPRERYNKVAMVDDKPVVFNMKLGKWSDTNPERKGERRQMGVKWALSEDGYNRKLQPLMNLYRYGDIGYVMIIPKNIYRANKESEVFQNFLSSGGIVLPFYAGRVQFRDEVKNKVAEYGLKLKG